MPFIILEDRKGFKQDHGWEPYLVPIVNVCVMNPIMRKCLLDGEVDSSQTSSKLMFYLDKEIHPGIWLYKERI